MSDVKRTNADDAKAVTVPEQLQLTDDEARHLADDDLRNRDLRRSFEAFHEANPGVYLELVRLCREAKADGLKKCGIGMLWEVLRWYALRGHTKTTDGYDLNNNHRAFYARLIMDQEPDLVGFFDTRTQRAA